jgi:hypothetical protein
MMATTTTPVVAVAPKKTAELFSTAVYGGCVARALDALAALDACVRADLLCGPVAPESAPRPIVRSHAGSLYEADTLTWRFYHANAGCVVHAINNEAYGTALARALYANLIFDLEEEEEGNNEEEDAYLILMRAAPPLLDRVRAALLNVRSTLRALSSSSVDTRLRATAPSCAACARRCAATRGARAPWGASWRPSCRHST